MHRIIKLFFYYILIFLGLFISSWIVWSRFIRQRTIRDIPDELFNEFRFWILLYICIIYIIVIKNLVKSSKVVPGYKEIIEIIYKPLTTLDEAIKYNKFIKPYYYKLMSKVINFINPSKITDDQLKISLFFIQIFPRLILVILLFADTFYFSRLELFYKVILLGILPFMFRYLKYTCKDIYEHWIQHLEKKYENVRIFEKGYEFDDNRIETTEAIFHNEKKTIREFIEIKWENYMEYLLDKIEYIYESTPIARKETYNEYLIKKYNTTKIFYTFEDIQNIRSLYYKYMPLLFEIKIFLFHLDSISKTLLIKWSKILIFSMYLLCWSYILYISYKCYPVELNMGKYFLLNFMEYLTETNNPFCELYWGSTNKNMITPESIKYMVNKILNKYIR